ncbi:histidine kinase [Nonomuraea sp. NBC_01738]|uniref:sensor histidine kinase n=1 Tax=Nonomuraea sp. NBC_01738 TaxID=2976003 RepID=UPI002E11887E|nr:histidine kinase [Nonomuraea sp. NBC_01738]
MRFARATRVIASPKIQDAALVAAFFVFGALGVLVGFTQNAPRLTWGAAALALTSLILFWRRAHPVPVAIAVVLADAVTTLVDSQTSLTPLSGIALYSAGRYVTGRPLLYTALGTSALYVTAQVVRDFRPEAPLAILPPIIAATAGCFLVIGIGQFVRLRAELRERGRRELAAEAVRVERRRIARELHDVVAHHISVINALVGGARAVLPPEPVEAREALSAAEQTARQALSEMRQLLQVLRADDASGPDAATGVGASGLSALVEQSGNASLSVAGDPVPLPAAVDHAVYRVVQEALTNARKHAPGARAGVRLAYLDTAVEVEVLDDGSPAKTAAGSGYGLGGMAERVALCGGRLETGPRARGGFRVYALLPLERS